MAQSKFKFTKERIDSASTPGDGKQWAWHYDTQVRGLVIGIGPKPSVGRAAKTFYLYRKIKGRPEKIKIGAYPDVTIERAREKAERLNAEIAEGKNPAELRRDHRGELTLRELFFDAYIAKYAVPHGIKTVDAMKDSFTRYLGELGSPERKKHGRQRVKPVGSVNWESRKLSHITHPEVERLHIALGEACGRYTANRVLELISTLFNFAVNKRLWVGENPANGIKPFKEVKRERFLQPDELKPFFQALADEPNEDVRNYFLLAILTGARRHNLLEMRWNEVAWSRAEWRIPETKSGEPQTVALVPEAIVLLRKQRQRAEARAAKARSIPSQFVFPSHGSTGHLASPKSAWARVLARAEIENLRIHDLRRSLGSWQARTGASLTIVGKSLGHKSPQSTAIYARLDLDPVRQSVETATSAMLIAAGIKAPATLATIEHRQRSSRRRRPPRSR